MAYPSTFLDIYTAVIDKGRLDSTADLSRAKQWVNQAYARTCIETEFFESAQATTNLVASQTSLTIPSILFGVEYIVPVGADGAPWPPMMEVPFQEILELRAWSGGTIPIGAPSRYAYRSSASPTIEFWPIAAGGEVLTFYGYQLPVNLSADGDLPIFPEPYASKCLEYGAIVDACQFKKDLIMLDTYKGDFEDWLERFRMFRFERQGMRVQSMPVEKQRPYPRGNSVDTGVY